MIVRAPLRVINVASVTHRSPFRYPGGKTWLVPYVRQWLKSSEYHPFEFAEPFAGGAIVGLSMLFEQLARKLTLVEKDDDVASVWEAILSIQGERFAESIVSFEFSERSVREVLSKRPRNLFERAFQTILKNRVQRGGILASGAGFVKQGENGRGMASRWYPRTLGRRITAIHEQRHLIRFIHGDGIEFIREREGRKEMVLFIDPPYTVAGRRLYTHSEVNHEELFQVVADTKGDFLMSYDNAEPVRKLAKKFGFDTFEIPMKNTHHAIMTELLIGRDLSWTKKPLELSKYPLFENLQADSQPGG